jgi:hypothetical protein
MFYKKKPIILLDLWKIGLLHTGSEIYNFITVIIPYGWLMRKGYRPRNHAGGPPPLYQPQCPDIMF